MIVSPSPRIVLIHAVTVAMDPIADAFATLWPQARTVNILDDSLSPDRAEDDHLTKAMTERIGMLGEYAVAANADAILYTCSAFGPAIEAAASRLPLPVLKPNEAMFDEALSTGGRVGMVATFPSSIPSMEAEFSDAAKRTGSSARLQTVLAEGAMDALRAGDTACHNRLVAEAALGLADCAAVMLAHFSTSRARDAVAARVDCAVITSPDAAVRALRARHDCSAASE